MEETKDTKQTEQTQQSGEDKRMQLQDVVSIVYITPENADFGEKNHFLTLSFRTKDENGADTTKEYDRVFLHRAFPFDHPEEFISVQDADKNEIGIIKDIAGFPAETAERLRGELARKYYAPVITSIKSFNNRYGYAYIDAMTPQGRISITLRDAMRSITRIDEKRVMIVDIDSNRYDIPDVTALDRRSYRQIELFL